MESQRTYWEALVSWRGNLSLENRMCVLYNGAKEFRGDGQYHYLEGSVQDED